MEKQLAVMAAKMESLGRNCEFGFIQRQLGAEPVSLLRWAGGSMEGVIAGLRSRWRGLMDEADGRANPPNHSPDNQSWWLTCRRYGIIFHTEHRVSSTTVETAAANVRKRLCWQAAKLISDIRNAERLFVYSSAEFAHPTDAFPLLAAMRDLGGAPWLVSVATGKNVDAYHIGDGLICATIPRLTPPGGADSADFQAWTDLLAILSAIATDTNWSAKP